MPVVGVDRSKGTVCSAQLVRTDSVIGDVLYSLGGKIGVNIVKCGVEKARDSPVVKLGGVQVKVLIESLVLASLL
jgi:hypothetical protein